MRLPSFPCWEMAAETDKGRNREGIETKHGGKTATEKKADTSDEARKRKHKSETIEMQTETETQKETGTGTGDGREERQRRGQK